MKHLTRTLIGFTLAATFAGVTIAQARYATWTGGREQVQLVGGGVGYNCEYMYGGQRFWRAFRDGCPQSIPI